MDFSKLTYDVTKVPQGQMVIKYFPELAEHAEYAKDGVDKLLRVAFLATDEKSPFVLLEREDYEKRLEKIFDYLKIKDPVLLKDISLGRNSKYEAIVNRFYLQSDNMAYVMWSNKIRMFHYIGISLRQPPDLNNIVVDMTKRAKLDEQLKQIYEDLVEYEEQVFPDAPSRKKVRKQMTKILQFAEMNAMDKSVI